MSCVSWVQPGKYKLPVYVHQLEPTNLKSPTLWVFSRQTEEETPKNLSAQTGRE